MKSCGEVFMSQTLTAEDINGKTFENVIFYNVVFDSDVSFVNCKLSNVHFQNCQFKILNMNGMGLGNVFNKRTRVKLYSMSTLHFYILADDSIEDFDRNKYVYKKVFVPEKISATIKNTALEHFDKYKGGFRYYLPECEAIAKLRITDDAKCMIFNHGKCRASKAYVVSIYDRNGVQYNRAKSVMYNFIYEVGKTVESEKYDEVISNVCSDGIHFFVNEEDAWSYNFN